ncbi:hypothetical protein BB560_005656 [Smittium megazygosporum]|uniref:Aminotransferase class I/classII large domain-containing protein n=1 Tax=Smittium megazygosporum TaxID=133381 RepID=A0A2T9Z1Q5_9FUNG|nr:hypothetical protein BB560_005656 [Smittium megazygosporum]
MTTTNSTVSSSSQEKPVYDKNVQQFHGGQDWTLMDNFIEDFSVTTNFQGTPKSALEAVTNSFSEVCHYPPINQEPAKSKLASFLFENEAKENHSRLILGNGASEVIDLVIRIASITGKTFKSGPFRAQYKEYERSAINYGFQVVDPCGSQKVDLACLVNPCNPTGDYLTVEQQLSWIQDNVSDNGFVLLDESMQIWHSSNFHDASLLSKHGVILDLLEKRGISVYIIHSWTKIWSCTGLRLGSVVCPTETCANRIRKIQIPWSVNILGLRFLEHVVEDSEYLKSTWELTPMYRAQSVQKIAAAFPDWVCYGESFLSWIWIDTKSISVAETAVSLARTAGVPIRSGGPGYNLPSFIRIAVREPSKFDILMNALSGLSKVAH